MPYLYFQYIFLGNVSVNPFDSPSKQPLLSGSGGRRKKVSMGSLRERRLKRRVKFDQNNEDSKDTKEEDEEEDEKSGLLTPPSLEIAVSSPSSSVGHSAMSTAALNAQYRARKKQREQQKKDLVVR